MKRNVLFGALFMAALFMTLDTNAQDKPAASPAGSVSTQVGYTNVSVEYSRPKMNGRKIYGEGEGYLVPFGKIWRTGANSGSVVTFDKDVIVGGEEVKAGSYLLLSVPGEGSWDLMLYSNVKLGGYVSRFKEEDVAYKYKLTTEKRTETVETFTIGISDVSEDSMSASLVIAWENTAVKLNITSK